MKQSILKNKYPVSSSSSTLLLQQNRMSDLDEDQDAMVNIAQSPDHYMQPSKVQIKNVNNPVSRSTHSIVSKNVRFIDMEFDESIADSRSSGAGNGLINRPFENETASRHVVSSLSHSSYYPDHRNKHFLIVIFLAKYYIIEM
jgi:hypothetical protein